ncbi:MAG: hypothetical protein CR967_04045 [Proteobacteria bacterium]|nr:MAG: hypothetical protein CR967_04045 [Pseudomonadota bacterium]
METRDDLKDILLEKDVEQKASKAKKIALIAGILILVFLIVVIAMKVLQKPEPSHKDPIANIQTKPKNVDVDNSSFKQVPIVKKETKNESFEEMVKKLKEKEKQRVEQEKEEIKVEPKQQVQKPKEDPEPKKIAKIPTIEAPVIKQVKPKKQKPKTSKPVQKKDKLVGNIYIQVLASTNMNPDKKFVDKIKASKYPYILYKTRVKGTSYMKLLIGPYKNTKQARKALTKIKRNLAPKAFIFRKK